MKIYQAEILDGLEDKIKSSASVLIDMPLLPTKEVNMGFEIEKAKASSNPDQIDLYYLDSILASIGWNKNDDVFDKEETWKSRNTPVDKPFNFMHNGNDIIGHITGSFAITRKGEIIDDSTSISELPDDYDIVTSSVIYKYWEDEDRSKQIDELITEIGENKWFVSMECLFPNFDYAIIDENGNQKILIRNEETAFLSKHLRIYGGTGKYKGLRVGRLLRNFTFSGKGLVDKPANPRSIIFNDTLVFCAEANINSLTETKGSNKMTDIEKEVERLRNELAVANEINNKLKSQAAEEAKKSYEDAIAELEAQIAAIKEELNDKNKTVAELTATVEEKTQAITSKEQELTTIKAEMLKATRSNKLAVAGVEADKVEEILNKFSSATEEMFDEIVNLYSEAKKAKEEMVEKEKCKSQETHVETTETKVEETKATEEVEIVDVEKTEASLATGGETESSTKLLEAATASLKTKIFKSTRK